MSLPAGPMKAAANQYPEVLLLGAVFQDSLYYTDSADPDVQSLPDIFHGTNKEDPYNLINSLISMYHDADTNRKEIILAFLLGATSHVFIDSTFHPLIYYFTGNYYDVCPLKRRAAIRKHREFEALLDLSVEPLSASCRPYDVDRIVIQGLGDLEKVFSDGIRLSWCQATLDFDIVENAYRNFRRARKLYTNKWLMSGLAPFVRFLPETHQSLLELSYFTARAERYGPLDVRLTYLHPVKGDINVVTIDELMAESIRSCVGFLTEVDMTTGSIGSFLCGPSLETGITNSSVRDMRIFNKD